MNKVDVKFITKRRKVQLKEHYLRDDIHCGISYCNICQNINVYCNLTDQLKYIIIPDVSVIEKFYEVLESPQIKGIIITQTTSKHLKDVVSKRIFYRFMKSLSSSTKHCVHFSNEHHIECYSVRQANETLIEWSKRLISSVVRWYSSHLEMLNAMNNVKIILLTENEQCYTDYPTPVEVLSLSQYLTNYHKTETQLHELYQSLANSNSHHETMEYTEYMINDKIKELVILGHLVLGKLRVNKYNSKEEAFVTSYEFNDILISGNINRNRAIHGDTVAVELLPNNKSHDQRSRDQRSHDRHTGRVVGVIERINRDIVACFQEEELSDRLSSVLVIPYDIRLPKIRIHTGLAAQLKDHRIIVHIDSWSVNSYYPNGHFIRSIGPAGNIETETQALLIEHELSRSSFAQSILSELPSAEEWTISEKELCQRKDLRKSHLIFSIDPLGCEDVDDTLSVKLLDGGFIELGVHIADVSHFVKPFSHTDVEARERSVTVYLADRRYDMLPSVLSANLCSLLSNVDRYAVSVIWTLTPDYHVKDVWYGKTVIRSSYQLTYEVAQDLYDDKNDKEIIQLIKELSLSTPHVYDKIEELRWSVKKLVEIGRTLRERRDKSGALELEGVEVKIQLTNSQDIKDIIPKQPLQVHETVAEFMIFANHWVAKEIYNHYPTHALLRVHSSPHSDQFNQLHLCSSVVNLSIDTSTNISLGQSLNKANSYKDPYINKVLRLLSTHAMVQALYVSTGSDGVSLYHYGLGLEYYTHFTSPIRRYADIIVHRLLLGAVSDVSHRPQVPSNSQLQDICSHMNEKNRAAKRAQIDSTNLFTALYFLHNKGSECEGIIYTIRANGVMVYIPRYGVQGIVYLCKKDGLVLSDTLEWTKGTISVSDTSVTINDSYTLQLMDHILVNVTVDNINNIHPLSLSMELASCHTITPSRELKHDKLQLVQAVKSELNNATEATSTCHDDDDEYSQQETSLYQLIHRMHALGLKDACN